LLRHGAGGEAALGASDTNARKLPRQP
jgi:hypothetical protein